MESFDQISIMWNQVICRGVTIYFFQWRIQDLTHGGAQEIDGGAKNNFFICTNIIDFK